MELCWQLSTFRSVKSEALYFVSMLFGFSLILDSPDKFVWRCDANDYYVKAALVRLNSLLSFDFQLDTQSKLALNRILKPNVPNNIQSLCVEVSPYKTSNKKRVGAKWIVIIS